MPIRALLLDLDGTLTDTNAAHTAAYADAFADAGYEVPYDAIRRAIGLGSEKLVPALIGEEAYAKDGDRILRRTGKRFEEIATSEAFRPLPGAELLLTVARQRALRTALCTASLAEELDLMFESMGHDLRPNLDVVTTSSDVEEQKPAPDVLHVAMERLELPPVACVLVGDTIYDAEAAARGGVAFIGVTTGAWTADELRDAGAVSVYADVGELAGALESALAAVEAAAV